MKSERRHELRENELAKDLGIAGEFVKNHLRGLITGLIVFVAALFLGFALVGQWRESRQNEWVDFYVLSFSTQIDPAESRQNLHGLAEGTSQETLAAWANVRIGDLAYVEITNKRPDLSDEQLAKLRQEGASAYQTVIDRYGVQARAVAKAYLGLGRLAETFDDFKVARDAYKAAADREVAGARLAAGEALARMNAMGTAPEPVQMAQRPEPEPPAEPAGTPAAEPVETPAEQPQAEQAE